MTAEEKQMFEDIKLSVNKHWIPFIWFVNLVNVGVKEGRIQQGEPVKQILEVGLMWQTLFFLIIDKSVRLFKSALGYFID